MNLLSPANEKELPRSDCYVIYSISNSPYQQWQADLLDFSFRDAGQRGVIVRLCSQDGHFRNLEAKPSAMGYTFVTPAYAELGDTRLREFVFWSKRLLGLRLRGRYHFYCLNKAFAMKAFLESHPGLDREAKLLWLDPDMVFHQPWEPPASTVRPGSLVGQYWWGYDRAWCQNHEGSRDKSLCPANDFAIMFPFCITVGDMLRIVGSYCRFSTEIYKQTRDWKSEMYGLVMAFSEAELECRTIAALGTCNNWPNELPNDPSAPISHYTQAMKDCKGREIWDKRKYTPCTLSRPWRRPPDPGDAATVTDQRTLQVLHRFIDWQEENGQSACYEPSK